MIRDIIAQNSAVLRNYLSALSGSGVRLVFSLLYFVVLANTLTIAEFGLFATASAAGVMLSRIVSFGFVSPLYRIATVKTHLIGVYTAGYLLFAVLSLPVLALASLLVHHIFFSGDMPLPVFLTVIVAETLIWRSFEVVVIVNNGMSRFGRGAILVAGGTMIRALAALAFSIFSQPELAVWAIYYLLANTASLVIGMVFFYPRQKLRLAWPAYMRRVPDALWVSTAEILFYLQMELDKLLVLALGGPQLAGLYAIIMRLVDLTAIPVRTFNMMLVQKLMREPMFLSGFVRKAAIESIIFILSISALACLAVVLHAYPGALGQNVASAAPLLIFAILIPGFRNLVEYQAELLYARGQTLIRAFNLALLAGMKALLLTWLLVEDREMATLVLQLNAVFAALYVASTLLTYLAMRQPSKRV